MPESAKPDSCGTDKGAVTTERGRNNAGAE